MIERGVILSADNVLHIQDALVNSKGKIEQDESLIPLAEMEKTHIIRVLEFTEWRISGEEGAANILEMHPNTLRSRMSKLGIRRSNLSR